MVNGVAHFRPPQTPTSSPAKVGDPVLREVQALDGGDYWVPAGACHRVRRRRDPLAGMTAAMVAPSSFSNKGGVAESLSYEVLTVWMPHSVLALPRQRPARASSSREARLVPGMHRTPR